MIVIRSFLNFCLKKGMKVLDPNVVEMAKTADKKLEIPDTAGVMRLLDCSGLSLRDKAILEVLYSTGMRVSELVAANVRDIRDNSRGLQVLGKGGKTRVVFLSDRARNALGAYLRELSGKHEPMFVRDDGRRLAVRTVQHMIGVAGDKCTVGVRMTPHVLRHCFATNLLCNGADIVSIKEMLGHANISTTARYTHVTNSHLEKIFDKFHS